MSDKAKAPRGKPTPARPAVSPKPSGWAVRAAGRRWQLPEREDAVKWLRALIEHGVADRGSVSRKVAGGGVQIHIGRMAPSPAAPTSPRRLAELRAQLEAARALPDDWDDDGAPAPSPEAVALAGAVLGALTAAGLVPDDVAPDAMGGLSFGFYRDVDADGTHHRAAHVDCGNSGLVTLLTQNFRTGAIDAASGTARDFAQRIDQLRAFLAEP